MLRTFADDHQPRPAAAPCQRRTGPDQHVEALDPLQPPDGHQQPIAVPRLARRTGMPEVRIDPVCDHNGRDAGGEPLVDKLGGDVVGHGGHSIRPADDLRKIGSILG